ncbi:uncharacterized protein LOC117164874 [Bombus vancouverensis nearcticus]|uniref:uncharacterized protein LOC117164874 n=1 Tax=Bombus vancouverensis nearcticus TaxID=2705178 RepID=UPI00402B112D
MDVFYIQYNTYRIPLSTLRLWPYHKSIYSMIHRMSISVFMLAYIIFQQSTTLKDQLEVQILMKYIDYSTSVISIFLCMKTFSMFVEFVAVLAII